MLKLRLQFFLVMLVICALLTTGLYLLIRLSFKQDFWHYIEKRETRFAQPLINDLTTHYHQTHNWNWVQPWEAYVLEHLELEWRSHTTNNFPPPPNEVEHRETEYHREIEHRGEHGESDVRAFREWREFRRIPPMSALHTIFLLDEKKQLIAGDDARKSNAFLIPLIDEGHTIGFLGVPFNPAIRDLQDADFAQLQEKKFALFVLISLLIAAAASFPLAHLLTQRIQTLVKHIGQLSHGNYSEKVHLRGSDELVQLADHLNHLGETLAQSEQARRQWVADISHELRTPIAVLQAELEAIEDGVRSLDKSALERLMNHSKRLAHLVNDLYQLSLTDLGGMTYRKNATNIGVLLRDAVTAFQPQFEQQHIELRFITTPTTAMVLADQDRLMQLFTNLLKNSLQYTNAPGVTQVTLTLENRSAVIVIEDTAPGVAEEHHGKLFERLYRAESSRNRATGGAGLGLSICKNIVAAHDGHISVAHSDLGGLKVIISIPCMKD